MKRSYEAWSPGADARAVVDQANAIITDLRGQGYTLTLRQLYYQFVKAGLIPNTMRSYKRLGDIVTKGRLAGLIDWSAIEDRTRNLAGGDGATWEPADLVRYYGEQFDISHWDGQAVRVEVWVEKEALAGVIGDAADRWRVPWFSCRGYVSASEMWVAAQRVRKHIRAGQRVLILHLGDHDPSGIDMTRDMRDRLTAFIATDWHRAELAGRSDVTTFAEIDQHIRKHLAEFPFGTRDALGEIDHFVGFELRRIALNADQIEEFQLAPNPARLSDSRAVSYIERFGDESWELDALDPSTLVGLIDTHIEPLIDTDLWAGRTEVRDALRRQFAVVAEHWDDIQQDYA